MHKYLVLFPIPNPFARRICRLMDDVAAITGLQPPYHKLLPHVTLHRILMGVDERVLKNLVASATLQVRQTTVTLHSLLPFGKRYVVLPVHLTRSAASLWVCINDLLSRLPEYEHSEYDADNTLHITVAAKTTPVFDHAWPLIQKIPVEPMTIPLRTIALYRKPAAGGRWEAVETFSLPS